MKILRSIVLMLAFVSMFRAYADDSDIYLNEAGRANPPYLMLMIDFTPDTGASFCKPLATDNKGAPAGCVLKMKQEPFSVLCMLYATPVGGNREHTYSACKLLWLKLTNKSTVTQPVPADL